MRGKGEENKEMNRRLVRGKKRRMNVEAGAKRMAGEDVWCMRRNKRERWRERGKGRKKEGRKEDSTK